MQIPEMNKEGEPRTTRSTGIVDDVPRKMGRPWPMIEIGFLGILPGGAP